MKKKISMFLAAVMIITLLPAMGVFAATSHEVVNYPSLPKDYDLSDPSVTTSEPPVLIIRGNSSTEVNPTIATFRLTLANAEWSFGGTNFTSISESGGNNKYGLDAADTGSYYGSNDLNYYIERLSSSTVQIVLRGDAPLSDADFYETNSIGTNELFQENDRIRIPLYVKTKTEGVGTVTISNGGSYGISNSAAIPFASIGSGKTNATIGKVVDFADMADLETLLIDELILGTIEQGKVLKLTLPNGFEFARESASTRTSGGLGGNLSTPTYGTYGNNKDKSILEFKTDNIVPSDDKEGSIIIDDLRIVAEDDDAKKGEVEITISGAGTTRQSIVVANFVSYDISFEAEDEELPVLVSGRYPEDPEDEEIETLEVTFKELTADTWSSRKRTTFTFPDGVKPRAVDITSDKMNADSNSSNIDQVLVNVGSDGDVWENNGLWKLDDDGLSIRQANIEQGEKAKIEMTFYLSIEPGFEGDIDVTVGNEGVGRESSATIATAVSPFTVETQSIQYPIGAKQLEVNDITIKETVAGAIQKTGSYFYSGGSTNAAAGDTLKIWIEDMPIESNSSKVEVTDGDMNIEKVNFRSNGIELTIKRASSTPSTIKITDTLTRINRDLPKGDYELRIGGSVVANYSDRSKLIDATFDKDYYVAYPDYVVVTTDVGYQDAAFNKSVKVTIGSTEIISGDDVITADVAPFIENGFTYVPLAATAEALGMNTDRDIIWNGIDKSVMVFTTNRTARMVANSNIITLNGVDTPIDSPVLIRDNRTFLPFRVLGEQVLGVVVDWDETTRTASYN